MDWRPELRFVEHAESFRRARGDIVSVQDDRFRVLHIKSRLGREKDAVRAGNVKEAMETLRQERPNTLSTADSTPTFPSEAGISLPRRRQAQCQKWIAGWNRDGSPHQASILGESLCEVAQ